jgi:hypothetical protein
MFPQTTIHLSASRLFALLLAQPQWRVTRKKKPEPNCLPGVSSLNKEMSKPVRKYLFWCGAGLLGALLLSAGVILGLSKPRGPLAKVPLADGRILQIERVTFGTDHRVGTPSFLLDRFGYWLPWKWRQALEPKQGENRIHLDQPGLVVWVNALDPVTGKAVDCQGIRLEFVDEHGDLFGAPNSSWFGGQNFWRVGHSFYAFPRETQKLTLHITPWKTNVTSRVEIANPHITAPARWSGAPLPQHASFGNLEIALTALQMRTNGGPKKYWEAPARYWEPAWALRQDGEPAAGWDKPEWLAEDATGNRGQYLGVHQPVLRFTATVYPAATNRESSVLVAALPQIVLTNAMTNIVWWNMKSRVEAEEILALGLFPKGIHTFSEGNYSTNCPSPMGPTRGGAPSGWVGTSKRISPVQVQHWAGHYTPSPVIYLHVPSLDSTNHLAIRLRDEQGRYFLAKPEPQGSSGGIMPFLIDLPPEVKAVVPEIILLKPLRAEFLVDTSAEPAK